MARSLRSKSRRRNESVKREAYTHKYIEQLKKTLGLTKEGEKLKREEIMKDVTEIAAAIKASEGIAGEGSDTPMEVTVESPKKSPRLKRTVYRSQRKIKKIQKATKKGKKGGKNKKTGAKKNKKNKENN